MFERLNGKGRKSKKAQEIADLIRSDLAKALSSHLVSRARRPIFPILCPVPRMPCSMSLAFTLTELLVVIGIIAVLMGLLIAFYRPSQEQRKVFECQNRLIVIHRALRMYSLDWDGFPASPYDRLDDDKDGRFDEDPPDGSDNDGDGKTDEDPPESLVGGLLALLPESRQTHQQGLVSVGGYLRTQSMLLCPSDPNAAGRSTPQDYSSYQGCDTGTGFEPQTCPQGSIPTYALTRFPPGNECHPSNSNILTTCNDPDKFRQLGILNEKPYFPAQSLPADNTVVTWCIHHRYIPNTTTPNYTKGGVPADLVLYWDGQVRIQRMPVPLDRAWRRKPTEP